jgi:CheY-like chemotaxis protein
MKSILLVDDDTNYLNILGLILESNGLKVTKATNGVEAAYILKKVNFDVMITDLHMPGMNGIQLAKKVKELRMGIFIILVTAGLSPDVVEMAANAGISHILSKPVHVEQLLENIKSADGGVHADNPNLCIAEIAHG